MKLTKSLLETYNKPEHLLVISNYPKKGETHSQGVCGLSSFTKSTLRGIRNQYPRRKIIVLSMIFDKEAIYEDDGILVIRCFKRDSPISYVKLLTYLSTFNKIPNLLVEFEFASFGNFFTSGLLPFFLTGAKIIGKQITVVIHQVVTDLTILYGHIGVGKYTKKLTILTLLLQTYYQLLGVIVDNIVVLEDDLKRRLGEFVDEKKIMVVPHGIHEPRKMYSKRDARKALGIPQEDIVLLYFGYITWYKGADMLIQSLKHITTIHGRNVRVIFAGGMTPTQKEKKHYQVFFDTVLKRINKTKHISLTGFINEKDMARYFGAADLVLFPYRACMSSSGPLALSIAYGKPFLLSKHLQQIVRAKDMEDAFAANDVVSTDILFSLQAKDMQRVISKALEETTYERLQGSATLLAGKRSYDILATRYAALLFQQEENSIFVTPAIQKTQNAFEKFLLSFRAKSRNLL